MDSALRTTGPVAEVCRPVDWSPGRGTMKRPPMRIVLLPVFVLNIITIESIPAQPRLNEIMALNTSTLTDEDGEYSDWIELIYHGEESISLEGWILTDDPDEPDQWTFPSFSVQPGQVLVVFSSGKNRRQWPGELHTDFKITSSGEEIRLIAPDTSWSDYSPMMTLGPDVSLIRIPDGSGTWYASWNPSPGTENGTEIPTQKADGPRFSSPSGFYTQGTTLTLSTTYDAAVIRFTLDGSIPSDSSTVYETPLVCMETTVIRATTYRAGMLPSEPVSGTYVVGYETALPVISILTHPDNLWSDECGIYAEGPNAEPDHPHLGANYWQDWEIPVHFEFIGTAGIGEFATDAGMSIHGGWTRALPQKGLRITARDEYGCDRLNFRFFPESPLNEFKSLILRNSGNDWHSTMIRDALMTGLASPLSIATQAYRPAVVFLNGDYWGIHNLRERISEYYLASHYGVLPDNVDIVERNNRAIAGDTEAYEALASFAASHDLSQPALYDSISGMMDIEDFVRYQASEIYYANKDWPANNIKCWRERSASGLFRWIMYDTDNGFCLYGPVDHNTLEFATAEDSDHWANPPEATLLLRKLLANDSFRRLFITRFCDLMNVVFRSESVLEKIDSIAEGIISEMPAHEARWYPDHDWIEYLGILRDFAVRRSPYVYSHISNKFDLSDPVTITIHRAGGPAGVVRLNGLTVESYPIICRYFPGLTCTLESQSCMGYRFAGWDGDIQSNDSVLTLEADSDISITARFEYDADVLPVVITEVNYNGNPACDPGDWVEILSLYDDHYLSGWSLRDNTNSHEYIFDDGILLREGQHIVIVEDESAFRSVFPDVEPVLTGLDYGFSGDGDWIQLYDHNGNLIDFVAYDDSPPWPNQADGGGSTLEVINPALPNNCVTNWRASLIELGTPCTGSYPSLVSPEETKPQLVFTLHHVSPNPLERKGACMLTIPYATRLELSLYDVSGRRIRMFHNSYLGRGTHAIPVESRGLAAGSYILHAHVPNGWSAATPLIVRQ